MNFNQPYKRENFQGFAENFLPDDFTPEQEQIQDGRSFEYTQEIHELGSVPSLEGLAVLEITHESEHDPRVSVTREAFKILKRTGDKHALVAFRSRNTDNYRISYIKMWPKIEEGELKQEKSNPRRYSFYLGPDAKVNTPRRFLTDKVSDIEDLRSRFAVEKVTQEFYDRYRDLYERLVEYLEDDQVFQTANYKFTESRFAKKLLSQIVFLYFVQKKGWLGAGKGESISDGDPNFLRNLFEQAQENNENFFNEYLEYLFYDALNKAPDQAGSFYRKRFGCKIPFLNGGLFEPINDYDWEGDFFSIPNEFFSNADNPAEGDGALDIFDTYNFTVAEDDPIDIEVSVDPEMLGKVFENLLEENIRKGRGTYYTPRIVVNAMCADSLSEHIAQETSLEKPRSAEVVQKAVQGAGNGLEIDAETIVEIRTALKDINVCDPACGSGSFLVGMLQHITQLKSTLIYHETPDDKEPEIDMYTMKRDIIEQSLYGVDIDAGAVNTTMLRLWLSLVVDFDLEHVQPLPNLDYKIKQGNSLIDTVAGEKAYTPTSQENGMFSDEKKEKQEQRLIDFHESFPQANTLEQKQRISEQINEKTQWLLSRDLQQRVEEKEQEEKKEKRKANMLDGESRKEYLDTLSTSMEEKHEIQEALEAIGDPKKEKDFFVWELEFLDVFYQNDGFDIVLANPPYGGEKVDKEVKESYELGSKDMYGVFIAESKELAKEGGVVSFITSDTWLTIGTHYKLREQMLDKQFQHVVRLHDDTFDATVSVCVFSYLNDEGGDNKLLAADLTRVPTREEKDHFREMIYNLKKYIGESTPEYAVYEYEQDLIQTNSNLPIFTASPKLFQLMNDTTAPTEDKQIDDMDEPVPVRTVEINEKNIELVSLGDIAKVKVGLQTGDNDSYLFQTSDASRTSYENIKNYREYVLTDEDLEYIANNEEVREKVIEYGIHKEKSEEDFDENRWFGGRYIVPYDKGGASDTESGWLPNYYVPTDYFIDWSTWAINRMRTMTIADRRRGNGKEVTKEKYERQIAAVFRNTEFYFREGISFSISGIYAPTFRTNSKAVFDVKGSCIFPPQREFALGILCSKLLKYISKTMIYHSVDMQVDAVKEMPILARQNSKIGDLVRKIIEKQKENPRYNYAENEQKEIDQIIYDMYGLNEEDIQEVETWYARRYPKLADHADIEGGNNNN